MKALFQPAGTSIPMKFAQKEVPLAERSFKSILKGNLKYSQEHSCIAHTKVKPRAKCNSQLCSMHLTVGTECFKVVGALTVPYNKNKAVKQTFFTAEAKRA